MEIGIIDFGGGCDTVSRTIENIVEYANLADQLNFSRFWLGEHYQTRTAWYNPEIYLTLVAASTQNIKVGSAGLLMAYHNPYRVALFFKQLASVFPERIDLGFAKGMVPASVCDHLSPDKSLKDPSDWAEKYHYNVTRLLSYLRNPKELEESFNLVPPNNGVFPNLWALGSTSNNLNSLVDLSCSYSRSLFHFKIEDYSRERDKLLEYKQLYRMKHQEEPKINLAVAGLCSKTDQAAERIRANTHSNFITANEIIGSPSLFYDKLHYLQELFEVDEFIFLNMADTPKEKYEGVELLANVFNLQPALA